MLVQKKETPVKNIRLHYSFLKVMTGHDLSTRRIPVMEIASNTSGPIVVLTACMHGDEIGGTVVIHELFKILQKTLKCGKVVAFPMLNPFGLENTSRRISISNEDLNRSFPGNPKGTLAQRMATVVMDTILGIKPAMVLDLHNDWNKSIPYVVIDPLSDKNQLKILESFAKIARIPAIQEMERIQGAFSYNLNIRGIPALTFELGESMIINEKNVVYGIQTVLNILNAFEMLNWIEETNFYEMPDIVKQKVLIYSVNPLCSSSGIIRFLKKPGEIVIEGDKLARVYNTFGKLIETIRCVKSGIVLGHNDYAVAYPGSPVMAFGVFH